MPGGFIAGIIVKNPIKVLENTLEKGTQITLTNDKISYIAFRHGINARPFKLDGAACKSEIAIKKSHLCRCDLAEDLDFGNGVIVSPPAIVSFENGKPKFFLKTGVQKWEYKGKEYKWGYYKPGQNGSVEKMDPNEGDNASAFLCKQDI